MNRSFDAVVSRMSLWTVALWTCTPNVGAWMMLGECSAKCLHATWSAGMPCYLEM
jgi:hypothetical protein